MKKNKFIVLVTSNNLFSFFFILTFGVVILLAFIFDRNFLLSQLAWGMLSLLGVFMTLGGYVSHMKAAESKRWPIVNAKLIKIGVYSKAASGSSRTYAPSVEYTFRMNGQDYSGNTIDFSSVSGSEAWAKKITDEIKAKGSGLMVYVNPQNPEISVLRPGVRLVHMLRYVIGISMIVAGILYALNILKL